ncbi:MAG: abortive phage infection protein [Oscillospiraceae bacterium]|nr:abortive phage infection protein [Oscillospiraceae bacterium]
MNRQEQLDKLLAEGDGILQTSAVIVAGVPKPVFYQYIRQNDLEQAAHGIYVSRDAWVDGMYLLHLRCVQAVFSHESALFFHDLTDREPSPYSVSVQRGYSPTRLKADGITVYTVKKELYPIGITSAKTPFGHTVPTYDMERTVCDLIRCRNDMEAQTFQDALKRYTKRTDKNLSTLMRYAAQFRVEKVLRQYLEVLL